MLSLKQEHEAIRAYLRQVDNSIGGIDTLLATAPDEQLKPLADKLFNLYHALLYLEYGAQEHEAKEQERLLCRLDKRIAEPLEKQHVELVQELDSAVVVIRDALQNKSSRQDLIEASAVVKATYYRVIEKVLKHMAAEDLLIDTLLAAGGAP